MVGDLHIHTQLPQRQQGQRGRNHSSHSYYSRRRARETVREKEAGATGGESGARAHGPALGGEAGSVLSISLHCESAPVCDHQCQFCDDQWCIRHRYPLQRQPNPNYNICRGGPLEPRPYSYPKGRVLLWQKYHIVRQSISPRRLGPQLAGDSGHCPQATANAAPALLSSRKSHRQPAIHGAGPGPRVSR